MQQQYRNRLEAAATEKQLGFIQALQGRELISEEVELGDLTKREASAMIDLALSQAKRQAVSDLEQSDSEVIIEGDDDTEPEPEEKEFEEVDFGSSDASEIPKVGRVDKIRFGLSAKLVYNKHEHGLGSPAGVAAFKKEVATTYSVLADLESEMSG